MKLLQSVLFATDFCPASEAAAALAADLAGRCQSKVTLLHVLEPLPGWLVGFPYAIDQARGDLQAVADRLAAANVRVAESRVKVGPAPDLILQQAEAVAADLLLIGAGEVSAAGAFVPGPVASAVLERAHQPVLAVRPGGSGRVQTILCPVDHSDVSRQGLWTAVSLARACDARLVVVSVIPSVSWLTAALESGHLGDARRAYLDRWREEFDAFLGHADFAGVPWLAETPVGVPHQEIIAAAYCHRADLIVMGSTGRTGLARALVGSVTRRVLRELPCSLLAVKAEGIAGKVFAEDVQTAAVLVAQGRGLLEASSYSAAADKFSHALAHDASDPAALAGLAEALDHLGSADQAAAYREHLAALVRA